MDESGLVPRSLEVVARTDPEHHFKGVVLSIVDVLLNLSQLHEVLVAPALAHIELALKLSREVASWVGLVDQSQAVLLAGCGHWSADELEEDCEVGIFVL